MINNKIAFRVSNFVLEDNRLLERLAGIAKGALRFYYYRPVVE
jgi:hypothetical protein